MVNESLRAKGEAIPTQTNSTRITSSRGACHRTAFRADPLTLLANDRCDLPRLIQIFANFAAMLIQTWLSIPTSFSSAFATHAAGNKNARGQRRRGTERQGQDHVFPFADGLLVGRRPRASTDFRRWRRLVTVACAIADERQ